jgi:hypothetical protein
MLTEVKAPHSAYCASRTHARYTTAQCRFHSLWKKKNFFRVSVIFHKSPILYCYRHISAICDFFKVLQFSIQKNSHSFTELVWTIFHRFTKTVSFTVHHCLVNFLFLWKICKFMVAKAPYWHCARRCTDSFHSESPCHRRIHYFDEKWI